MFPFWHNWNGVHTTTMQISQSNTQTACNKKCPRHEGYQLVQQTQKHEWNESFQPMWNGKLCLFLSKKGDDSNRKSMYTHIIWPFKRLFKWILPISTTFMKEAGDKWGNKRADLTRNRMDRWTEEGKVGCRGGGTEFLT